MNLGTSKQSTPTISKNLNPEWKICFDMPLVGVPLVECICWDRDRWGKDYMGEFDIAVEDIFANGKPQQEVYRLPQYTGQWRLILVPGEMVQAQVKKKRKQEEDRSIW